MQALFPERGYPMAADDSGMRQRIRTASLTGTHLKNKTKTTDMQAKKDKLNKNIYKQKQTNEKQGKTISWQITSPQ